MVPYDIIVQKIHQATGLSKDDIEKRVKKKLQELSGLLSEQGAAHIVANELAVDIMPSLQEPLVLKDIFEGMKGIKVKVKILAIYEKRSFKNAQGTGQVQTILVGDHTKSMRITFWHEQTMLLDDIQPQQSVLISNVTSKQNRGVELHATAKTKIEPLDTDIVYGVMQKTWITSVEPDTQVKISGVITQAYKPTSFERCPVCKKRIKQKDNQWVCDEHGAVEPTLSYVANIEVDDGSGILRVVCFDGAVQQLMNPQEWNKDDLLGTYVSIEGKIVFNELFERTECIAQRIDTQVDAQKEKEEIERLFNV
ncbi:MAG: hypothetical protein ACMXYC_00070 [Candidatus Woesearchaeota archaeon]